MAGQPRLTGPRGPIPPLDRDPVMDAYIAFVLALCLSAFLAVIFEAIR